MPTYLIPILMTNRRPSDYAINEESIADLANNIQFGLLSTGSYNVCFIFNCSRHNGWCVPLRINDNHDNIAAWRI